QRQIPGLEAELGRRQRAFGATGVNKRSGSMCHHGKGGAALHSRGHDHVAFEWTRKIGFGDRAFLRRAPGRFPNTRGRYLVGPI
ncbi:MAG: hypothetical protein KC417_15450, partial [Myxococcales bacterium]|nr:hypothetical protein [Myxococcales bacterium]